MTPYQKAITGIDEKARDKLIRGLTMTKPATPMPERTTQYYACKHGIPGGCQFCNVTQQSAMPFRRTPDVIAKLESDRGRLIEALGALAELGDHVPVFQLDHGKSSVKAVRLAGKFVGALNTARSLLRELEEPK